MWANVVVVDLIAHNNGCVTAFQSTHDLFPIPYLTVHPRIESLIPESCCKESSVKASAFASTILVVRQEIHSQNLSSKSL